MAVGLANISPYSGVKLNSTSVAHTVLAYVHSIKIQNIQRSIFPGCEVSFWVSKLRLDLK